MIVSDDACYEISVLWKPIRRINHLSSRRGEQQSAWRKALRAINRRLGKIEDSEDDSRKGAKVAKFGEKNTFFARLASWREKSLRGEGDHSYIDLRFAHLVETLALFDDARQVLRA